MKINSKLSAFALGALVSVVPQIATSAVTQGEATTFSGINFVTSTSLSTTTSSTNWVDVPNATITVPRNAQEITLYNARFSAESVCSGAVGNCQVRIVAGGAEMTPAAGRSFAFDSIEGSAGTPGAWESHAIERSASYKGPCSGTKSLTFKVQYRTSAAGIDFRLDDWHLTLERFYQGMVVC